MNIKKQSKNYDIETRIDELLEAKSKREARKITRETMSRELGLSLQSITNWALDNLTRFDETQIISFCLYFDCSPGDLFVMKKLSDEDQTDPEDESRLVAVA